MSKEDILKCKIVLLSGSGDGKTCIIDRYVTNTFTKNVMASPGASYIKKLYSLKMKINLLNLKYGIQMVEKNSDLLSDH